MISMQGLPSSLILRNESWVRKQAHALARRLPSNVEKADLIQVGLIAVAQAALGFQWEGDRDSEEAKEAFVRYARQRVHGAMIDELRQMDNLSRGQRRKIKLVQVARERWRAGHDSVATAADISPLCGLSVEEIFQLDADAHSSQAANPPEHAEDDDAAPRHEPATERDEVEARVDTGMLMRRLERFFATLPERDRQVIDAYLGVGLSPVELAAAMKVSPSRISQMFRSVCERIGVHLGHSGQRSTDRLPGRRRQSLDALIDERETELAQPATDAAWAERFEKLFNATRDGPLVVDSHTRWG